MTIPSDRPQAAPYAGDPHAAGTDPASTAEPDGSHDQLGAQFVRLLRLFHRVRCAVVQTGPDGLEAAGYAILFQLIDQGPQRASHLADTLHSDISTISRQSSALVRHGLVERLADPGDGRAALLSATSEGLRVFEESRRNRNEWWARILGDWSAADRLSLNLLLDKLSDTIEKCEPLADKPLGRICKGD